MLLLLYQNVVYITFWVENLAQIYSQQIPNQDMEKMWVFRNVSNSKWISFIPVIWFKFSSHISVAYARQPPPHRFSPGVQRGAYHLSIAKFLTNSPDSHWPANEEWGQKWVESHCLMCQNSSIYHTAATVFSRESNCRLPWIFLMVRAHSTGHVIISNSTP